MSARAGVVPLIRTKRSSVVGGSRTGWSDAGLVVGANLNRSRIPGDGLALPSCCVATTEPAPDNTSNFRPLMVSPVSCVSQPVLLWTSLTVALEPGAIAWPSTILTDAAYCFQNGS